MDGKGDISSGITVRVDETLKAPKGLFTAPHRLENPPNMAAIIQPVHLPGSTLSSEVKKRRGRPRKYDTDGVRTATLSPMPISASIPLSGDFSGWKQPKARPAQVVKKAHKVESNNLGERLSYSVGANFTPHVMTVNAGEDINLKIISFSRRESRAICVLSACGSISNVTLRQPSCAGGTLTYQGVFEILSLSGSFTPIANGIAKSICGGISVLLAGPDGRVVGGGLAGVLVAGSPVKVVLGSFLQAHHQEHTHKKQRDSETMGPVIPAVVNPVREGGFGIPRVNFTTPTSFHANNLPSINSGQNLRDPQGENNASTPEGDSDDYDHDSPSNLGISGGTFL